MTMHPDDYDLDAIKEEWIGKLISEARGRYPVEFDPIRRHCHMVGDLNPAFLDPEIAAQGPHGGVIVPPSMLPTYFAADGPWPPTAAAGTDAETTAVFSFGVPTPGDRGINMEVAWEYLEPIRVGDTLRLELRIADVFNKPISLDPSAIWIVTETAFFNQHDTVVARWRNTMLIHRSPEQVASDAQRNVSGGKQP
ncbi:MAG: MaoC family dehydratase N-terminal domain-containing protein [Gammaproteobacteria bacterium]|jgi:acyl dehydratase|nr:MaoC family dehydratase N-terminal domain-containing protein [Gammaproteobacteria bacterium]